MLIYAQPLSAERDILDHRRACILELLSSGMLSAELHDRLVKTLAELESRIQSPLSNPPRYRAAA